jgi:hypothetical protein
VSVSATRIVELATFRGLVYGFGTEVPRWVSKLNFPPTVGMYNNVIGYDVDRICVLFRDEIREHSADDWGHTTGY